MTFSDVNKAGGYASEFCIDIRRTPFILEESQRWTNCPLRENASATRFYVDLEESCKKRAAKEVKELKTDEASNVAREEEEEEEEMKRKSRGDVRLRNFLKDEQKINRIETCLSEYYMETVCQKLWENAQNAVFHGVIFVECNTKL